MRNALVWFAVSLFICACGGGGGGDGSSSNTPPASSSTFHLSDDGAYDPGYSISFLLSGESNTGDNFTGKISIATKDFTIVDGRSALPIETLVELENVSTGAIDSSTGTTYVDATTHDPIRMVLPSLSRFCTPASISEEPDMAEIGDFGELTSYTCNDGRTITGTWSLKDAGNGRANLVETDRYFLSNGNVEYIGKTITRINESGNPLSVSLEIYYPSTGIRIAFNRSLLDEIDLRYQVSLEVSEGDETTLTIDTVPDSDCNDDGTLNDPELFTDVIADINITVPAGSPGVTLQSYKMEYIPLLSTDTNYVYQMPPDLTGIMNPGAFYFPVPSGSTATFTTTCMTTDLKAAFETLKAADPSLANLQYAKYLIRFTLFFEDEFFRERTTIIDRTVILGNYDNC